jgi:hypothetical protein
MGGRAAHSDTAGHSGRPRRHVGTYVIDADGKARCPRCNAPRAEQTRSGRCAWCGTWNDAPMCKSDERER